MVEDMKEIRRIIQKQIYLLLDSEPGTSEYVEQWLDWAVGDIELNISETVEIVKQ